MPADPFTPNECTIPLWPAGSTELNGVDPDDAPSLTPYLPAGSGPCAAVIVCPGGGYEMHAAHEGGPVAEWLATLGIAAFVLVYRLRPHRLPAALHDAQRAIRTVRHNAEAWNVDPDRVGILGFSAGGHLAATAGTKWNRGEPNTADPVDRQGSRPDAMILCYPVISFVQTPHVGSVTNTLGPHSRLEDRRAWSAELNVTSESPPAFLWSTADDAAVDIEHSLQMASALHRHGVPVSLHFFPHGEHGLGLAQDHPEARAWPDLCASFLRGIGFTQHD